MPTKTAHKTILKIKNYKKGKNVLFEKRMKKKYNKIKRIDKTEEKKTVKTIRYKKRDLSINKIVKNGIYCVCI